MAATNNLPQCGHYAIWRRASDCALTAGVVPRDNQRQVIGDTIEEQTAAVFERLETVLNEANAQLAQVVKLQVYLADLEDMRRFNTEYARQIADLEPVRTTIGCQLNEVKVEIDAMAYTG